MRDRSPRHQESPPKRLSMVRHDLSHSFLYLLDFNIYYTFDAVNELKIYGFMNTPRRYLLTNRYEIYRIQI